MLYFAYGSNMSIERLQARISGAIPIGLYTLGKHTLRFHKIGHDLSGKCNAYFTDNQNDNVIGVAYNIAPRDKTILDTIEGVGNGYDVGCVQITSVAGRIESAFTYVATHIDNSLRPYTWYKEHVLRGARTAKLPDEYIAKIEVIAAIVDQNSERELLEMSIYNDPAPL